MSPINTVRDQLMLTGSRLRHGYKNVARTNQAAAIGQLELALALNIIDTPIFNAGMTWLTQLLKLRLDENERRHSDEKAAWQALDQLIQERKQ